MTVRTVTMAEEGDKSEADLKEWSALHHLMLQIPAKYQNLLVTGDLQLTSVSAVEEHVLLGTNTGSVYWYDCVSCAMRRYRREGQLSPVSRVSAVTSVDHLLAAGHRSGDLSVFLVPRLARGEVPEYVRITESNIKKSLQFGVPGERRAPISALCWSQNASRLFSGDEAGTVVLTEIDYIGESVTSRIVLRESAAVVQLQYSQQTLLVATRDRSCLLRWPDGEPRQVGTKPRKSPAELGACFLEGQTGLEVLAARPSLKVVTADLEGSVKSTISLKPTLESAPSVELLYPVSAAADPGSGAGPGRLLPLWPGAAALYDRRRLLVVDVLRWEIRWRCDRLPAVLDVASADGSIYVLCSGRRLVRLAQTPDRHPAVCENLRPANGDLRFDDVMQDLKSAVPVTQVKTLISNVSSQLERTGLLDALSSRAGAVSSLTSRVGSLVASRLGGATPAGREQAGPTLGGSASSPDVRPPPEPAEPAGPPPAAAAEEPIARQVRSRRRPGRRGAARSAATGDTVSLGGESAAARPDPLRQDDRRSSEPPPDRPDVREEAQRDGAPPVEGRPSDPARQDKPRPADAPAAAETPAPPGPLDFTQFYPSEVRPSLEKSDSQLEEERKQKERRLAALLGLADLSPPPPPPPPSSPPPPVTVSSPSPSPPSPGVGHYRDLFGIGAPSAAAGAHWDDALGAEDAAPPPAAAEGGSCSPPPAPSYHSLFAFGEKPAEPRGAPPRRPPSADSETGEPRRAAAAVRSPSPPASRSPAASRSPSRSESEPAGEWLPWERQLAPSFVMTLSACARYAVVTDPDGRVYSSPAAGPPSWERRDYSACQVSVSYDGRRVWRLEEDGSAHSLADPEPGRPRGSHWVRAAREVLQLSADSTAVWYIKRGGKLFVQRDLSAHRCASPELSVDTPGQIMHVSARQGVIWAVTVKGQVLWRVGVSRAQPAGLGWEQLPTGRLLARAVYLGAGETAWMVDDRGRLHVTTGVSATLPRGMDGVWRRVLGLRGSASSSGRQVAVMSAGAALRPSLAVEGELAWFSEPAVMNITTNRRRVIGVHWEQFTPRGRTRTWAEVFASGLYQRRGQLWALSAEGKLFGGNGHDGELKVVPLPDRGCQVQCVSAAPGTLWLLTAAGEVFVREGVEQSPRGTDWVQLDLMQIDGCRLTHLSVGAQSVWACDAAGRVLARLGPTVARRSPTGLQPAWVTLDSPPAVRFVQVCVGPGDLPVWALDQAGLAWRRCGAAEQPLVGTHWQPAGGLSAAQLALSPSAVWARARGGAVHRWLEAAGQWCRVPGTTAHVSASVSGELWVVHSGSLYTLHELALRPGQPVTPSCRPGSASSDPDDRDWELVTC